MAKAITRRNFIGGSLVVSAAAAATVARVQGREKVVGRAVREGELEPLIWERYQNAGGLSAQQFVEARKTVHQIGRQPAMSVPLHWNHAGLPIGVMFAGRFGDESTLFRLAGQLEQAQPWFDRTPPVLP